MAARTILNTLKQKPWLHQFDLPDLKRSMELLMQPLQALLAVEEKAALANSPNPDAGPDATPDPEPDADAAETPVGPATFEGPPVAGSAPSVPPVVGSAPASLPSCPAPASLPDDCLSTWVGSFA